MTEVEFEALVRTCVAQLRDRAPRRTGNLAENAIKIEKYGAWDYRIYIDEGIAPYQIYLEEGKRSRHRGWWGREAQALAQLIAAQIGGIVE